MRRLDTLRNLFQLSLALLFVLLPACATLDYIPPGQGTSAALQSVLAKSLEENLKEIPFDPAGKRVNLQVRAGGAYQNTLGLEGYTKSLLREWVLRRGGEVGPGQFQMVVFLPVLGETAVRRDLSYRYIPFYYSERFRASARMIVVIKDATGRTANVWYKGEGADLADVYLMRIFGPMGTLHEERTPGAGAP
jgi:hypothetical protein